MPGRSLLVGAFLVALAAIACARGSAPTQVAPTPSPAAPPQETYTPEPRPTELTPEPTPTPTPAAGVIRQVTEEELQEVLRKVRFSTRQWPKTNFNVHSVPLTEFLGGGPGKDDIPPIDNPEFVTVEQASRWLAAREPVQVAEVNGDVRAYPLQILIWHEVVNDVVGGEPLVVTY